MKSLIKVEANVRFLRIPYEMVRMFNAILIAAERQGVQPTITGAWGPEYPPGKVHDSGYAIDVRTSDLPDPPLFAAGTEEELGTVGPHYKVLYGDAGHLDHIHIGFAWYYARQIP